MKNPRWQMDHYFIKAESFFVHVTYTGKNGQRLIEFGLQLPEQTVKVKVYKKCLKFVKVHSYVIAVYIAKERLLGQIANQGIKIYRRAVIVDATNTHFPQLSKTALEMLGIPAIRIPNEQGFFRSRDLITKDSKL